jgi:hypothetical protein
MSDQVTTDNFWQVWNSFEWPEQKPPEYRCYYRDDGQVDFYTMEAVPGNYILVNRETYVLAPAPARVIDGQVVVIKPRVIVQKLRPNAGAGTQCHPNDVTVVAKENGVVWSQQQNEID